MNTPKNLIHRDCPHGTTIACGLCPDDDAKRISDLEAEIARLRDENKGLVEGLKRLALQEPA